MSASHEDSVRFSLSLDAVRDAVADLLEQPAADIRDDDDLLRLGLDSVQVIRLASRWRRAGAEVTVGQLFERRTLAEWWELLSAIPVDAGPARPTGTGTAERAGAEVADPGEPFDLAPIQLAYWIGRGDGQVLGGVGAHFYAELDGGAVRADRLERAVRAVLARHGMLRARFLDDGRQRILPVSPWPGLRVHDLSELSPAAAATAAAELREQLSHRRLAVEDGEVVDVQLTVLPGGSTRVHVAIDMLVADAQSFRVVLADLASAYAEPDRSVPALDYDYPSYLADRARAKQVDGLTRHRARDYWQARLPDLPGGPELPLALDPSTLGPPRMVRLHRWLSASDREVLADRARARGFSPAMVFLTAFAEVLGRWSARPRFLLNLPLYDREDLHPDVPELVGDFTSLLLLEVDTSGELPFAERVARLHRRWYADISHADYSGVDVLRDLARTRPGMPAAAPVVFTSALALGELFSADVRRLFGDPGWTSSQTPQVWLDHQLTEREDGLFVNWDMVDGLFPAGVPEAMFAAYCGLLDTLLAGEEAWDATVPVLLPAAQAAVREKINSTDGPIARQGLHEPFFAAANEHPQRLALVDEHGAEVGYGHLAAQALAVAATLLAAGVRPAEPVAVTLPKGAAQLTAVLGILAAGGAYVPVGVDQPVRRRARILAAAGARVVLTDEAGADGDWPVGVRPVLLADARAEAPLAGPIPVLPEQVAYVLFTSGSTGEPKCVEVPHLAAVNTIDDLDERFGIGPGDRALALSALDFDLSVYDVFGMLSAGAAVVMVGEHARRDPARWVELVTRHRVTVLNCVPALADALLRATPSAGVPLASLRLVLLGGDRVGADLPARLVAVAPGCRFVALGGTTETAIHSTACEVAEVPADWRAIPYGTPLRNVRCRVVDDAGRDRPDRVTGELWIGGAGVALGYRGDPDRTADRFVRHADRRWYRTGDLACWWPDGTLEFLGRADTQLKVRGHRIEPAEVEAALEAHPDVLRAVVAAAGSPPRLGAVVLTVGADLPADLREFAARSLPVAMLPDILVAIGELPLSANGKVDRRAVAALVAAGESRPAVYEPPHGPVEPRVAEVWAEVLGAERVGRKDSFFALGGDSLLAIRVLARLRAVGLHGGQLRGLFTAPALADFAAGLTVGDRDAGTVALAPDPGARFEPFPPTDVQRAYWMGRASDFVLGGVGSHWYWEYDGEDVDVLRLEAAWNVLVERHDMLRAVFDADGWQQVLPRVPYAAIPVQDAEPADAGPVLAGLREDLSHRLAEPSRWPLVEIRAVRYGRRTRIAFSFDYIVLDALSIVTVMAELSALYVDESAPLRPVAVTFRDYVLGARPSEQERVAALRYWEQQLDGLPSAPQLPLRTDPARVISPRFVRRELWLQPAEWDAFTARARSHDVTPAAALAAAFAEVLAGWSARPELTLTMTLFDRRDVHPDIGNVLGDFTSLLLVGCRVRPGEPWLHAVRRMQEEVWSGMEHAAVSAIEVLRLLARRTGAASVAMPVVFTSALGVADELVHLRPPFGEQVWGVSQTPQVWLDNQVTERHGGLSVSWDAVEDLFPDGMLDAMVDAYGRLLRELVAADWSLPAPDLLPAAQREVRAAVNATAGPQSGRLLHAAVLATAAADPGRLALAWGEGGRTSYGELGDRAGRVAGALVARGVRPGDRVAVTASKGPDQVAAVLGVLIAGAVYVPLGVDQPVARRARMQADSGARLVVTTGADRRALAWPDGVELLEVAAAVAGSVPLDPVDVPVDALAYVIYTSGSTGAPKGVEISHRAAVNTCVDVTERFGVGPGDRVLAVSALDFDLSVYDLFGVLGAGGVAVLVGEDERREAARWVELVRRWGVTVWNTVPALLDMLLLAGEPTGLGDTLRLALVSGDWVGLDLPPRLAAQVPGCRLVALGGATEAAIWSNAIEVGAVPSHWSSVPYGRPLRNQSYRVVNGAGRDRPDWVPGELWIGGTGLARGYHGDPDRTADRFVVRDGHRWYRTGDLGRYWPDGTLEFLGREDFQVKLRGHRIELGEIEAALEAHTGVARAVAAVSSGSPRRLVAGVLAAADPAADRVEAGALRAFLAERLPASMLPEQVTVLDAFPLTGNGKLDRAALVRTLAGPDTAGRRQLPAPGLEAELGELWTELLDHPVEDRTASFFALGGDSVVATRMVARIRQEHGLELSLRQLFATPTIADLAAALASQRSEPESDSIEEGVL